MKKFIHLISSFSLLFGTIITYASSNLSDTSFQIELSSMNPLGGSTPPGGVEALNQLIGNVTNVLLFLIPILAGISLLFAGYFYIFSAGDSEKANKAKTIIKWNIIAIFVAFLSFGIIKMIASFF